MAAKNKPAKKETQKEATKSVDSNDNATSDQSPDLIEPAITIAILQEADGSEPFTNWLNALRDREAKQRILARIAVVRRGSLGLMRSVGEGVSELKIDYAGGYRLYFGRKGNTLVVLIMGGDKDGQTTDIARAQTLWKRYKDEITNL